MDELDLAHIGPKFEKNAVFPARTNTEFVEVSFENFVLEVLLALNVLFKDCLSILRIDQCLCMRRFSIAGMCECMSGREAQVPRWLVELVLVPQLLLVCWRESWTAPAGTREFKGSRTQLSPGMVSPGMKSV